MITRKQRFLVLWGLCIFCMGPYAPAASAQFAENTGIIQGTVKDQSGAVLPGAKVTLGGVALVAGKEVTSDSSGFFRFAQLPPGTYEITVTATSFKKHVRSGLTLDVGKRLTLDIEMEVGAVTSEVVVSAAPEQIDITSSKSLVYVPLEVIDITPKGRGILGLIEQAPGARSEPLQGGGFQIDGASAGENTYAVEGQDTTSIFNGLAGVNPPTDFFREVTVKSSGYEAEHGGAMGGVVNMVVKSAGNAWHGFGIFYFRHSGLDAGPRHFVRGEPGFTPPVGSHISEPLQSYVPRKDRYRILEPGFELGGPVWKDRIWLYTSYIPQLDRNTRTVIGTNVNSLGPRAFTQTINTHFEASRLDGKITNALRAWAVWEYNYRRSEGTDRPDADDITGLTNASAATDARTRRADRGTTNPNVLWRMGADWTPTQKAVVAGSYGKWFVDNQDRGVPVGVRHLFNSSNSGTFRGLNGAAVPAGLQHVSGFSDIPNNNQVLFDQFARTQVNTDGSYVFRGLGTHTIKGGYSLNRLSDDLVRRRNTALTEIFWGQRVNPSGAFATGCAPIIAANLALFSGPPNNLTAATACRGNFGYWRITDFQQRGKAQSNNHGIYIQDTWNLGYGFTANVGIRFEKEFVPAFNAGQPGVISKPISFDFSNKASPRLGGTWDVMRNGKIKVYGSWGWFYDIMKYSLPRGSFGGDYWHNCLFTLDTSDWTTILPGVKPGNFACNSGAIGSLPGTFIGEEDLRIPSNTASSINSILDPALKPVRQTEFTLGGEWGIRRDMALEVRWARKRLRNTIEDMGILGPNGEEFIIGNPGERIGSFPLRGDCAIPGPTPPRDPRCDSVLGISTLPGMPKARREYDGLEFRLDKRFSNHWYLNASYTWSRLFGNYSGLTNTDEEGRSDPNNNRSFDEQEIQYNWSGKPEFGRLNTDRPHTFKAYGGYELNWMGMRTTFGVNEQWYTGTPLGTRVAIVDVDILPYVVGRGVHANITQDTIGNWVLNGMTHDTRVPMFTNSDFNVTHEFKLSKANEALRLQLQFNGLNLFNFGRVLTIQDRTDRDRFVDFVSIPDPTCITVCASVSTLDRHTFFAGTLNAITEANNAGLRLRPTYGHETRLQGPRALRLMVKVQF